MLVEQIACLGIRQRWLLSAVICTGPCMAMHTLVRQTENLHNLIVE